MSNKIRYVYISVIYRFVAIQKRSDMGIFKRFLNQTRKPKGFLGLLMLRVLKPNGRLVLRDYSTNPVMLWMINHIELKLANLFGHGDVCIYPPAQIKAMCETAGLEVIKLNKGKMFRLHLVAVKNRPASR